jgi:hypothetical protein
MNPHGLHGQHALNTANRRAIAASDRLFKVAPARLRKRIMGVGVNRVYLLASRDAPKRIYLWRVLPA